MPVIVKTNCDLRQEVIAMQLMRNVKQTFDQAGCKIYLRPYDIFITANSSGFVEFIPDTISLEVIREKYLKKKGTLKDFFKLAFPDDFEECQKNFVESLAGYTIFNYIFQVRDRTPNDILIDAEGHMIQLEYA